MPAQRAGSPKKCKTKHKAADSDLGKTLVEGTAKRLHSQADVSPPVQPPHHRAGAGKGGRNSQLERISALLDVPARATKPKGSTTLDSNAPVNPLAPVPPSKGCGSRSKAPPPYSASQPAVDSSAPPSKKQGKKFKNIAAFASSIKVPNQLNFVQCEDGERFGLHPPIIPSHKEQVLNTSITAKSAGQKPATMSIDASSQSDLSNLTSVNTMPHSQADFFTNIDPSFRPIHQEAQGEANYCGASLPSIAQEAQAEVSTSDNDNDNSSTDDG
ncbi:hypothetical protein DFH29DRAFT_881839 [Suillus ampliporus]|nr:hypothetical protein DFH29DRAFT_881839 [Suillus ampliporus]